MRFQGNVVENLMGALKSKDEILAKEILVDEMAQIIENNPKEMIKTLRYSKVNVSDTASKKKLVNLASYNLHNNPSFQKNLAVTIVKKGSAEPSDYDRFVANPEAGEMAAKGGGKGGAGMASAIASMIGSIGKWGSSRNDLKAEEARTKSLMYQKIFGQEQKINWMPIIVVGGVLLIGALVVWRTTAKNS